MRAVGHGRRAQVTAALTALAAVGMLTLTGCRGDDGQDLGAPPGPGGGAAHSPAAPAPGAPSAAPTANSTPKSTPTAAGPAPVPTKTVGPPDTTYPTKKPPVPAPAPTPVCAIPKSDPNAPNWLSLYRYSPEGGSYSLILRHGTWTCTAEGAVYVPSGEETWLPISDTAEITATSPILTGAESRPISTSELTGWLESHPDPALPFRYHLNKAGVIDRLYEFYMA